MKSFYEKYSKYILIISLIVIPISIYLPSLNYDFVWDDQLLYLTKENYPENNRLQNIAKFWNYEEVPMYTPVTFTFWGIISSFSTKSTANPFGLSPLFFHLANILIHAINSLLIYLILFHLLKKREYAWFGAIIFAVHPINVEVIAWVSEARGLLMGLFGFLSIFLFIKHRERVFGLHTEKIRFDLYYILSVLAFLFCILSKPIGIIIPIIIFIIDLYFYKKKLIDKLIKFIILFLFSIPTALIASGIESQARYVKLNLDFPKRLLVPFDSLAFYLYKIVYPFNLSTGYGRNEVFYSNTSFINWTWILPVLLFLILYLLRRKITPIPLISLIIFFIGFLPVSGIITFYYQEWSTVADRYIYLSMFGISLITSVLISRINPKGLRLAGSFVIMISLIILTFSQIGTWKNDTALWENAKEKSDYVPANVYLSYGEMLKAKKQFKEALENFNKAIQIHPYKPNYLLARGLLFQDLGEFSNSIVDLSKTLNITKRGIDSINNSAILKLKQNKQYHAEKDFKLANEIYRSLEGAYYYRAKAYLKINNIDSALNDLTTAIQINPKNINNLIERGKLYYSKALFYKAIMDFQSALILDQKNSEARELLSIIEIEMKTKQKNTR